MLNAQQKADILKRSPELAVYLLIDEQEKRFDGVIQTMQKKYADSLAALTAQVETTIAEAKLIKKGDKPVMGVDYPRPLDGYTPSHDEWLAMIMPLIPKVKDGRTPSTQELERMIKALLPKSPDIAQIASLVLANLSLPTVPTAETIVGLVLDKFATQTVRIDQVEGLAQTLKTINRNIVESKNVKKQSGGGGGGGMGNWVNDDFIGDGFTTTFHLTRKVASNGTAIIILLQGQVQEQTTHYSVTSNGDVVFTTAPLNLEAVHAWYVRK